MGKRDFATILRMSGLPIIGNLIDISQDRLDFLLHVSQTCGDIGVFRIGLQRLVLVNASELVYEVLVRQAASFEKPALERIFLQPGFGNGLVLSDNTINKRQRKIVAPAFHKNNLTTYADIVVTYTQQILHSWGSGETINLSHELTRLMLWINGQIFFSTDLLDKSNELGGALSICQHYANAKFSSFIPTPYSWPTPGNVRFLNEMARLDATLYRIIHERKRFPGERGDVLSMLLQAQDEEGNSCLDDVQVRDEAMTLFLAGHETMANALSWTFYLLALHPRFYHQLQDEATRVLGNRSATFADLPALPYTLQIFKEAMRLYPPIYMIGRQTKHAVKLGNHSLPANALIVISPYTLHRRPDYFSEPEIFDPGRFTPEFERGLPQCAYIPFSFGPRICIGNRLALMEAALILSTLSQHLSFHLVNKEIIVPEPLITLRPKNGLNMIVQHL